MIKKKVLKAFSVLTFVFVIIAFASVGGGVVYASTNTVIDVKSGQYIPVLIYNGMTDVASVRAYAEAKGAFAAINATYFDAYTSEDDVLRRGGDVNPLRTFGHLYGLPLNFPSGVLIDNGKLVHGAGFGSSTGQWGGYLGGVTKQGDFIVEQVTLNIGFIVDGNRSTVWRVNRPSYEDTSVTLYDQCFGRDVQLKPGDKAIIVEGGVIKDISSHGPVKVPANGFIIVASSSANVFYGNKNIDNSFSIGQQASWTWEINSPSGYNFKDVYFAVGSDVAKINGVGGANRSYIGGTADGKISIGVGTAAECVNALFLDGGGSIAYYKDGSYLRGPGRNVSNAIGFVRVGGSGSGATPAPTPAPAQEIKVLVNGTALTFDQPPIIENGRTLVPLRAIFEALGADVDWEQSTQTVTAVKDDITIVLKIGDAFLTKNGERITLDVPAKIVGGRTLVPARAVAESFGAEVGWDQTTRTVTIKE